MREANEIWAESGDQGGTAVVVNTTELSSEFISAQIADQYPEVASMVKWGRQVRRGGLFERDKYLTPPRLFDQMRVAQEAAENDDVVAGVVEGTESLAFGKMSVRCDDPDEENVWNQILEDIDLDTHIRAMWREMFIVSQFYAAAWWDQKTYTVKGRNKGTGVQRKKKFANLRVPTSLTILDPLKVTPVGNFMFNQEQLAWIATRQEAYLYDNILSGLEEDLTVQRLLLGRYNPTVDEMARLGRMALGSSQLFLLNPDTVWRMTATRPQYKPFAEVRMKSIFELLDLKNLLRELDRALLLGATNFIVLIRKGTEKMPAKNAELAALQASISTLSQIPVIVGDHRLAIDIITPKADISVQPEKWNTIDARITARLYGMFMTGNFAAGAKGDDSAGLMRIVARGLESRRNAIRKSIERNVLKRIYDLNETLTCEPSLVFHPKSIAINFDPGLAAFFMDLLDRREVSRATVLEQVDLDEEEEALRLERENEVYDEVFKSLTPLQDPEQQQKFALAMAAEQQKNALELAAEAQKDKLDILKKEQLAPKPTGVPALKGTPTATDPTGGAAPAGPTPPGGKTTVDHHVKTVTTKTAPVVKKPPANADPKSAGRSGGGNRKGGGAAPGTGQGQPKDARRGAKS